MFKEDYIKDNNQIHPDEDFLTALKETIRDEKQKPAQGEKGKTIEIFIGQEAEYQKRVNRTHRRSWSGWAAAACVAFVCILGVMLKGIDLDFSNDSLKGDVKSVFHNQVGDEDQTEQSTEHGSEVSEECKEQYQRVLRLFEQQNVIIYETDNFMLIGSGMEYLNRNLEDSEMLGNEERSRLVGDILAKKYTLTDTTEDLGKALYYIAEFEDGSGVSFIIGDNEYIYIHEMWGLQGLADRRSGNSL